MLAGPPRNPALDALRALAISLVVAMHVIPTASWVPATAWDVASFGARGVDLFFVLSGYLVGGIALREIAPLPSWGSVARFIRRRWYRTLPAYFAAFALYLGTLAFPHEAPTPPLWSYLVFLQSYVSGPPGFFALSWSLCIEEHFYLALPLLLLVLGAARVRRPGALVVVVVTIGLALIALRLSLPEAAVDEKVTHWRTDALITGVVLAGVEVAYPRSFAFVARSQVIATLGAIGLVALAALVQLRFSRLWQPAFAVACGGLVVLAAGGAPWLRWVGSRPSVRFVARSSYAVYLMHSLVLRSLEKAWFGARWERPSLALAFVVLGLGGTLVAALALHRWIEAPMLARRDRLHARTVADRTTSSTASGSQR